MKNNLLCKQCNSVISKSDTAEKFVNVIHIAEIDVKPVSDHLKNNLISEMEITIAEMETYQESFNTAKKHLKELKKW